MSTEEVPPSVVVLLWDVDVAAVDLERDRDLVLERVMTRGTWDAMKWLRARYSRETLATFLQSRAGLRLPPRDRAYWALIADVEVVAGPGGSRPKWAG